MSEATEIPPRRPLQQLSALLAERQGVLRDYLAAISGAGGRLVFSLLYFVALANTLSLADFGLFAAASAAGVVVSRFLAFGFISALYRTATIRPRLIGTYSAGFLALAIASLPVIVLATIVVHLLFFSGQMPLLLLAQVVVAEALLWRATEVVIIVNNGLGNFGRGAGLTIFGTLARALFACGFMVMADHSLAAWTELYLAANAVSLLVALAFFYPRQRLRFRSRLYWRRLPDSLYVAGAEVLFYLQMEFDKFIVLAIGGANLAGLYAIIMRLVDLTAIPIRTFSMLLVQKMMRAPDMLASLLRRWAIELGIFVVSTGAICALALVLHVFPNALGRNVAQWAGLVIFALCIPGLRNIVEYHAELLFARGQTLIRMINLALLAGAKAVLLAFVLSLGADTQDLIVTLNWVFAALFLLSSALTHSALRLDARPV